MPRIADLTLRWALYCFAAAAAALPFGSMQELATNGFDLASLLALAGGILILPDVFADRLRVPFELVWPVLLLLAVAGCRDAVSGEDLPWGTMLAAALGFLGAAHATRHASVSWVGPAAWALFAPVTVVLTAGASMEWLFPESWSRSGQPLLGASDLTALTGTLLLCGGAGLLLATVNLLQGKWRGILYLMPVVLAAGILMVMILFLGWPATEMAPAGTGFTPDRIPETLILLYLGARIAAKLTVAARNRRTPELVPGALACLLGTPAAVLWPPAAAVPLAVTAGMLAGPAISRGADMTELLSRGWRLVTLLPLALVMLRLLLLLPGDPRNYVARADRLIRLGRLDAAESLLRQVHARIPGESRAMWQLAWLALGREEPNLAAYWAVRALRAARSETPPAFLSHPTPAEIQQFIDTVRDTAARNTAEGYSKGTLALGQVLLAAGRTDQAVALLDALTRDEPCPSGLPPEIARRLLAWVLDTSADTLPESLPPDALWAALRAGANIRILPLPQELAGRKGTIALAARIMEGWVDALAISGDQEIGGTGRQLAGNRPTLPPGAFPESPDDTLAGFGWTWTGPLPGGSGKSWYVYHPAGIAVSLDPLGIAFQSPVIHYGYRQSDLPDILLLFPSSPETNHMNTDKVLQEDPHETGSFS